ncbi:hypothetical protein ACH5BF_10055 [Arcobacter sp. YIC-464]
MRTLMIKGFKNSCILAAFSFALILLMHMQNSIPVFRLFTT